MVGLSEIYIEGDCVKAVGAGVGSGVAFIHNSYASQPG